MISIVIPTFNEEKNVGNLLDALIKQDFSEEMEIVVADADSRDKTRQIIEKYRETFRILKIVPGGLPAIGRNNGAKASSGDPIFFIDADLTIPQNTFLRKAVDYFRKNKLAVATVYLQPKSKKWLDYLITNIYNFLILQIAKHVRPLGAMCIIVSRNAFTATGGYPEDVIMAEDHDFVLKCSEYGPYDILPLYLVFSTRRFEKEGRFGLIVKYLKASFQRVVFGPIKKFDYEFTYSDDEDSGNDS